MKVSIQPHDPAPSGLEEALTWQIEHLLLCCVRLEIQQSQTFNSHRKKKSVKGTNSRKLTPGVEFSTCTHNKNKMSSQPRETKNQLFARPLYCIRAARSMNNSEN
jgi:hypothetical protein